LVSCPQCAGRDGVVGYNARLNVRCADDVRDKYPGTIIMSIPINTIRHGMTDSASWCRVRGPPWRAFSDTMPWVPEHACSIRGRWSIPAWKSTSWPGSWHWPTSLGRGRID
jgi:hypothetical protein